MDSIIRAAVTYFFVWMVFRISGKHSFSQMTTFDFILLLIISETTQASLMDQDNSMTNSFLLIGTFIGIELVLAKVKQRSAKIEKVLDGTPVVLIEDGQVHHDRLHSEMVDESDILAFARQGQGLERLEQIKFAVLEKNGDVSIIPNEGQA